MDTAALLAHPHALPSAALRFETTQWSVVLAAGGDDPSASRRALATLCETYWYPLYAYVRRRGIPEEDARDLTQGFLASLIERESFDDVRQERGRFRSFLLASLKHYLANDYARRTTLKRGGDAATLSLAMDDAEGRYRHEPAAPATPETIYERRWALTVIDGVLQQLRAEAEAAGGVAAFDRLKACLLGDAPSGGYAAVAEDLGTTEGAVKAAVHRLRRRFQQGLRTQIGRTVATEADVEDEIRYLIRALNA